MMATDNPEPVSTFASLVAAPVVWAAHLMLSYVTAAIWCAKLATGGSLGTAQLAIAAYTVVALALVGWIGWRAWRRQRGDHVKLPDDRDSPAGRQKFLAYATLLLAGMSAIAIFYAALATALAGSCW